MTTIINGSSPSITFSDSTTQSTAGLTSSSALNASNVTTGTLPYAQLPAGSVLQVVSATKTDTSSTSSTTYSDISGLSVSITPKSATSKIFVILSVQASNVGGGTMVQMVRNLTAIGVGTASSNRVSTSIGNYYNPDGNTVTCGGATFFDSPATTSATTYKAQFRIGSSGNTSYINISPNNTDASYTACPISTITVMEIAQ